MPPRALRSADAFFWIPGVLVAGVALSLVLHSHLRHRERRETSDAANELVRQRVERLHVSILRSMEVLHSVAALHAAHGGLDRALFRAFVRTALARQPELQALSWNPVVPRADRERLESQALADGVPGFHFREAGTDGHLRPAADRAEYVPVYFIEPPTSNQDALGFDLASDPERRRSLERARQFGTPVATSPVRLAQGPSDTSGLLVLLPVYHESSTAPEVPPQVESPPVRDGARPIAGFAVAVFRIRDLVGTALLELDQLGLHAELFDDSPRGERIFTPPAGPARAPLDAGLPPSVAWLEVAGRRWAVAFQPTTAFAPGRSFHPSSWALALGLLFTLSTCAHLGHAARRTREIARANAALRDEVATRQRAEAAAAAANQAKTDFVTRLSHELRTPLNAILGYAQILQRDSRLPPEPRDAGLGIQTSGQHLLGLINEVLDLAKIEAGRMELHVADFDLAELAHGIATTFRPLCAQKHLAFHLHLPDAAHSTIAPRVRGDAGKLRQILINLVGNAIKFTRIGEVQLHLHPLPDPPDHWLFEVLDTGLGIPEEERADIFKPFHQGAGAGHQGGTGLGLAIARHQVQLLGGTLAFTSERGVGSRFHFHIPLPPAPAPAPGALPVSAADFPTPVSAEPVPPVPPPPASPVALPAPLHERLQLAAELHSSTALKACLAELLELGPDAARLAEEIRWRLRSFDLHGIQLALRRSHPLPPTSPGPAGPTATLEPRADTVPAPTPR